MRRGKGSFTFARIFPKPVTEMSLKLVAAVLAEALRISMLAIV
jgi:hypothetical protein